MKTKTRPIPFWEEPLTEALLQYVWEFQYFNTSNLVASSGEIIRIINPGKKNYNQGPDFLNARIEIGNVIFSGSVEIHLRSSLWKAHGHHHDDNYRNVILHVVYENDLEEQELPLLELRNFIPRMMLEKYRLLMDSEHFVSCQQNITEVSPLVWTAWKDRLIVERLVSKSTHIIRDLEKHDYHWELVFWWHLAGAFGLRVNHESFYGIARSIPLRLLGTHRSQILQLEALLFGQSGLLSQDFSEAYPRNLKIEYQFLQKKYSLIPAHCPIYFHRMRPANFPSLRLAQLAMMVFERRHAFATILETQTLQDARRSLQVGSSDYWNHHYRFEQLSGYVPKSLGASAADSILLNTIVPFLYAYGTRNNSEAYTQRALDWLHQLPAEDNAIIQKFHTLGISAHDAYDSQALLHLKSKFCDARMCLHCMVGNQLLKSAH